MIVARATGLLNLQMRASGGLLILSAVADTVG